MIASRPRNDDQNLYYKHLNDSKETKISYCKLDIHAKDKEKKITNGQRH